MISLIDPLGGPSAPKFEMGELIITPGAMGRIDRRIVLASLRRHHIGDWGELEDEDKLANEQALKQGGRLFSVYLDQNKERFYIITESTREYTTILLPEEY